LDQETQTSAERLESYRRVPFLRRLSTKLLLLTVLFVVFAEILIFIPSVAAYRLRWLEEKLGTVAAVGTVLIQGGPGTLSRAVQDDVLDAIGVQAIAVRDAGVSRLLVVTEVPPEVDEHIALDQVGWTDALAGAAHTLLWGGNRLLRVYGQVGDSDKQFELVMEDSSLRSAMLVYARNIALMSLLILLATAAMAVSAINRLMIGPIRGLRRSLLRFARAPDDPSRIIRPTGRRDELGVAENELASLQTQLQATLSEQKHLADLGLAVSKINHDMRNMLASAQLFSDRLADGQGPGRAGRFAPKLVRALDRAVAYSEGRARLRPRPGTAAAAPHASGCGSSSTRSTACPASPRRPHRLRQRRRRGPSRSTPIPSISSASCPISRPQRRQAMAGDRAERRGPADLIRISGGERAR
jgi:signal transduction histidine kinase